MPALRPKTKWRPPLWLVVAGLVFVLVTLPLAGLVTARLAGNQFVRETERSLISQAAIFAEIYVDLLSESPVRPPEGNALSDAGKAWWIDRWRPVEPSLDVSQDDILEPVPAGEPLPGQTEAAYRQIAEKLGTLAIRSQKTTLAGYRFTDAEGRIIAGSGDGTDRSLAHLLEVQAALVGEPMSTLRFREPWEDRHPLTSISRDTGFRVHLAYPVILEDRVVGALFLSRTPIDLRKFLYRERHEIARMAAIMLVGATVFGWLFWRLVSRPIRGLRAQSHDVAIGRRQTPEPLAHYGVSELAELGRSLLSMADTLTERSRAIQTYTDHVTHELKSPVTTIVGAAEILETTGERLDPERRERLLQTIHAEGLRMDALLANLRDLARARSMPEAEDASINDIMADLRSGFDGLNIEVDAPDGSRIPLTVDELEIVLTQLFQNAQDHGAGNVSVSFDPDAGLLIVDDDGEGISAANLGKVLDPFFTTKRESGGTGMGLAIVKAIIDRRGGSLSIGNGETGCSVRLEFGGA